MPRIMVNEIHLLHHGATACGAYPGTVPRDWPLGVYWENFASYVERERSNRSSRSGGERLPKITCQGCLDAVENFLHSGRGAVR